MNTVQGWHDFGFTQTVEELSVERNVTEGDSAVGTHNSSEVVIIAEVN
jgi:hypothetical protein